MRRQVFVQFALSFLLVAGAIYSQSPAASPKATGVLVMLTIKPTVAREQVRSAMPDEVRATVRLYLDGKIREWYSRSDGKGVIFLLDCKDSDEARSLMEGLPLSKANLADYKFIPVAPLAPLGALLGALPQK